MAPTVAHRNLYELDIIKINHIASIKQTGIYLRIFQDDNIVNNDNAMR